MGWRGRQPYRMIYVLFESWGSTNGLQTVCSSRSAVVDTVDTQAATRVRLASYVCRTKSQRALDSSRPEAGRWCFAWVSPAASKRSLPFRLNDRCRTTSALVIGRVPPDARDFGEAGSAQAEPPRATIIWWCLTVQVPQVGLTIPTGGEVVLLPLTFYRTVEVARIMERGCCVPGTSSRKGTSETALGALERRVVGVHCSPVRLSGSRAEGDG